MSTRKKFHAPSVLAFAIVLILAVSLLSIGFYIGAQGAAHERIMKGPLSHSQEVGKTFQGPLPKLPEELA